MLHDANVLVGWMCGKVRHAVGAVASGCDFVVAQGTEGGGHTGTVATMALVPQVVDAVGEQVPVVAAGGLFDGRGLAAALTLGADGVWIGTRFIATPEARAVDGYKETLLATPEDGTVISRASPARRAASCATTGPSTSRSTPTSCSRSPARRSPRRRPASTTSAHPRARRRPRAASSCPAGRASAPSTRWSRPASWSPGWWTRPSGRCRGHRGTVESMSSLADTRRRRLGRRHPPDADRRTSRIPNVSKAFDADWAANGHMDAAVDADPRLVRGPARSPG